MSGLGVLDDIRPADCFDNDPVTPARPGSESPSTLVTSKPKEQVADVSQAIRESAELTREQAIYAATETPTSTTLTALAQAHALLGERDEAVHAAHRALEYALKVAANDSLLDSTSVRLAAEILMAFGEARDAYEALSRVPRTRSLRIVFAVLAFQMGETDTALHEVEDLNDPLAEAVKGYIFATVGDHQKAVGHLRAALREQPNDPDSLLNLSISLSHLGARRKAAKAALRATRVAPGRKDVSLHYMGLLLDLGSVQAVEAEIRSLKAQGVIEDSDFLVLQARTLIAKGTRERAIPVLAAAADAAAGEGDDVTRGEVLANLVSVKHDAGRMGRDEAVQRLEELLSKFPSNDAVVVQFARFADRASQAPILRAALERVRSCTTPLRLAYLRHQVAYLEGDNAAAADAAADWYKHEPANPMAAAAAIVAIGIGMERWDEALIVARHALSTLPANHVLINNAAYVLAMAGHGRLAIDLLEPVAGDDFVLNATLGLAHLADGDIETGMALYRQAANTAEAADPTWRSLMTGYQALVVRQLGLLDADPDHRIGALALVPFDLPTDWQDRPDFLRLWNVAKKSGYGWPLSL